MVFQTTNSVFGDFLMRQISRFFNAGGFIVLAVALAFLLYSNTMPLSDVDEGAFSEASREMLASGNLVSPTLNGEPRHDKPILIYWAQAAVVTLIGQSEFAFRLPSILATLLWLLAIDRFCRRHTDAPTARVAGLVMALTLLVGLVAKAAIADGLLNLFLALALFYVYDYFQATQKGQAALARRSLIIIYGALGLGFLTKGPVAVMFPLLIGTLFFVMQGAWRSWLKAVFYFPGWLLFLLLVVPWHVMVYLDQGDAFFRGFYLHHNLNRYASTFEGHGGNLFYYLLLLPLLLLPFSGWLMAIVRPVFERIRPGASSPESALERFLVIWFVVVFIFFSLSRTQLPHYLLYGCTPLFILLACHHLDQQKRLLAFVPVMLAGLLFLLLPHLLGYFAERSNKPFEQSLLLGLQAHFSPWVMAGLAAFLALLIALYFWRRLAIWQALVIAGCLQAAVFSGFLLPSVLAVTQEPIRQAAAVARQLGGEVVIYRLNQPSFSVYRQAPTVARLPRSGELALLRVDRVNELAAEVAPLSVQMVYQNSFVALARIGERP